MQLSAEQIEQVHVIIGEIPFRGEVVKTNALPEPLGCVKLLETICDDQVTDYQSTEFFARGTHLVVQWEDEAHPVTGYRQCRLAPIPLDYP